MSIKLFEYSPILEVTVKNIYWRQPFFCDDDFTNSVAPGSVIRQVCKELGVQIVSGVLSGEQVHMFVEIPPK